MPDFLHSVRAFLLYISSIAAVCVGWYRWVVQAVQASPGKVWSAIGALSPFRISNCLDAFGGRLSMFHKRIESCFSEAIAYVRQTLAHTRTKFMALVWAVTMYPVVLAAMVGLLCCSVHLACFLPGIRTSLCVVHANT